MFKLLVVQAILAANFLAVNRVRPTEGNVWKARVRQVSSLEL